MTDTSAIPVDLEAVRQRYDDHMTLWAGPVEAMHGPFTAAGAVTCAAAASAADVPDLRAEVERLRAENAALGDAIEPFGECQPECDCGDHKAGPCDCHVTGQEARAEIRRLRSVVEAAREFGTLVLRGSWSEEQAAEFIAATQARGEVR